MSPDRSPAAPTSVVVVGFDAMDPTLASELAGAGEMPNLGRLAAGAAHAVVRNPVGFVVGGIWPSYVTATGPASHGRHCYAQLVTGTYDVVEVNPWGIHGEPWWAEVAAAGGSVCNVDIPFTVPRPEHGGVQVVDWGSHDRRVDFSTHPAAEAGRILGRFGRHGVQPRCDALAERGDWESLRTALVAGAATRTDVVLDLVGRDHFDLVQVVYGESHCAGHQFWAIHDVTSADHPAELRARLGDPLVDVYRALDTELGRLLEAFGDALVYVLLSHGMGPHHDGDHLIAEILRRLDGAGTPGGVAESGSRLAHRAKAAVRPAIPERLRLAWYRYKGSRSVVVRRAAEARATSRFFKLHNNTMYSGIRFNLAGREPAGRVHADELADLTAWLAAELEGLVETGTGRRVVDRVLRVRELYDGPHVDDLPDLLVDWNRDAPIHDVTSATIGRVTGRFLGPRTGDHRLDGRLFVTGPGVGSDALGDEIDLLSIGPTIAANLGVATSGEGRPHGDVAGLRVRRQVIPTPDPSTSPV